MTHFSAETDIKTMFIYTKKLEPIIIDPEDFSKLQFNWYINNMGYATNDTKPRKQLHRLVMNEPKDMSVDHINGNKLDNRKSNLRVCTHQQNLCNQKLNTRNKSGFKGVSWNKIRNKWETSIMYNQKHIFGGYFDKKELAAIKYNDLAVSLFGVFANINKI